MSKTSAILGMVKQLKTIAKKNAASSSSKVQNHQVIEGEAKIRDPLDTDYADVQQMFRHQFPSITRQVLGRHYTTVNQLARFVVPNGLDQAADEVFKLLSDFSRQIATTDHVLHQTGQKNIEELQQNLERSQRASRAFKENNKILAVTQGAICGATGVVGAAIDLPVSVIISLKTIYEIGHVYGFELDNDEDQRAVYHALSKADIGLVAEKQTILLGLRTLQSIFKSGDYQQLQNFLGTGYSIAQFQDYFKDQQGQYKWSKLQWLHKISVLKFVTPVIGGAVAAYYNVKMIDAVAKQADEMFASARQYLQIHHDQQISVFDAYQQNRVDENKKAFIPELHESSSYQKSSSATEPKNDAIVEVQVQDKDQQQNTEQAVVEVPDDIAIQKGIEALAEQYVETPVAEKSLNPEYENQQTTHNTVPQTTQKTPSGQAKAKRSPRQKKVTKAQGSDQ
ncbi:hypothetical protein F4V57_04935 [Acinetobacter qingfengensis]|uniref:EcsC family protein n=1 Tax=Acinetobacter qingfengensis TaxID=1262585 RepID=A0A1E7RCM3_9GAMM|nr:EcsC family protein [Acinetobacter qingfengensis]KAA8734317.1 hypothetical protein F4V57_04935 [Acinetobacter qingfengensis]OEY97081.1 hypothetical protein BJI46_10685 [Acinetobacter qingfengensis]